MISLIQKNKLFSMKLIKATALTVSCMVSLPGFSQTNYQCVTGTIGSNGNVGWSNTYCYPISGSNGTTPAPYSFGIQDSGADNNNDSGYPPPPPQTCSATMELNLRTQKQKISGCYGDPGSTFNMQQWYQTETGFWNTFLSMTFPILPDIGWYNAFISPITDLANGLIANNGDQYALYTSFADAIWHSCDTVINDGGDGCEISALYLIQSYYPNTSTIGSILNSISNFFGGPNLVPTVDYDSTWGGRLVRDVQDFRNCHLVYQAWNDNNCSGNF